MTILKLLIPLRSFSIVLFSVSLILSYPCYGVGEIEKYQKAKLEKLKTLLPWPVEICFGPCIQPGMIDDGYTYGVHVLKVEPGCSGCYIYREGLLMTVREIVTWSHIYNQHEAPRIYAGLSAVAKEALAQMANQQKHVQNTFKMRELIINAWATGKNKEIMEVTWEEIYDEVHEQMTINNIEDIKKIIDTLKIAKTVRIINLSNCDLKPIF